MLTPLQIKKQTHYFNILDFDKNGYIQRDDFEAIGENLCIIRDFDYDSHEYNTMMNLVTGIWDKVQPYLEGDECSLNTWLEIMDQVLVNSDANWFEQYVGAFVTTLFDLFDINRDGYISQTEYVDLFIGLRIEVRFAPKAFRNLDLNRDGKISRDELMQSVEEFIKSNDPAEAGNWLFGAWA